MYILFTTYVFTRTRLLAAGSPQRAVVEKKARVNFSFHNREYAVRSVIRRQHIIYYIRVQYLTLHHGMLPYYVMYNIP